MLLAPSGFQELKDLPLVLNLHGGGGSRDGLKRQAQLWSRLWKDKTIPPAVVVMPSVGKRSFYMNYRDGSEQWEDFIMLELIPHLRKQFSIGKDSRRTLIMGVSMGGMGALRMAFKYPEFFGAVAALEPGISPVLKWQDLEPKHRFWRDDELFEKVYGKPVNANYWALSNPASIARANPERLIKSDLQIYFEAGDQDQFWLYEGAEFLHQILWQQKVRHEYHLVRGADHVGGSLGERTEEAIRFLFRTYRPWDDPPMKVKPVLMWLDGKKSRLKNKDHYSE
jgi:S-formylglutathione hydrolase